MRMQLILALAMLSFMTVAAVAQGVPSGFTPQQYGAHASKAPPPAHHNC